MKPVPRRNPYDEAPRLRSFLAYKAGKDSNLQPDFGDTRHFAYPYRLTVARASSDPCQESHLDDLDSEVSRGLFAVRATERLGALARRYPAPLRAAAAFSTSKVRGEAARRVAWVIGMAEHPTGAVLVPTYI